MTQLGATQEHFQGFRSVYKSKPHSITVVPFNSPNITNIDCYTDPDTNKDFIYWEDIQQAFEKALFVRNKTKMLPFVRGKDYRALEPRRIEAAPDVVLDVVVGDTPIAATNIATADIIASLQVAVQELSLKISHQTPIEGVTQDPSYSNEREATQDNSYIDNPEYTPPLRGHQASECRSQDSNNGITVDTQLSDATNTNKDFILWEDIQQAFDEVVFVRNKTKMLPFVRGKDHRVLEPRRIAAAPDVVLDVVVGDEQVATNDTATADMIASLQRTVQELLLNIPRRTSIESVTHVLPCGSETKATQTNNYNDNPDDTSLIRRPRTSECHLEDSNKGVLDTQRSSKTGEKWELWGCRYSKRHD
ncbi:MAG: hypothetical protein JOS17DRAFT_778531 [Linnemannia elongata]|nr:MAG: hypothetical protein JOS17DRAFT_778531 [Linnemannia elongata]